MKISVNWLKDYIDFRGTTEELDKLLTNTGLEVEGVERTDSVPGGLQGLVIGEVLTCEKHPNADRLNVTTVDVGEDEPYAIVCGAPNVAVGQKVVVALPGTMLYPTDGEPFKIKKGKIRGEVSNGMICAEDEIGLGKGHDGIMVLEGDVAPGTDARAYFNPETEETLEIGLTPNRADAASHIGVARDLVALSKINPELGNLMVKWPDVSSFEEGPKTDKIKLSVEDTDACPRYCGILLENVKVEESPEWLKKKLISIGLSPINNVVDITNFVLHEMGQPLHAFDAGKIGTGEVKVKCLPNGTKFVTLDGEERELHGEDLMICDGDSPMCIAGVLGGLNSGVSGETTSVFLESAYFKPVSVRKTAKRHGLNTDASFRFERGIDPEITVYALKRAALLIQELAGGVTASPILEHYPNKLEGFEVTLNLDRLNALAGTTIEPEVVEAILEGLDIKIVSKNNRTIGLAVPAYRVDVQREADVIEEVLRIYGFDNIPLPDKMAISITHSDEVNRDSLVNRVSDYLVSKGFLEGMSNSQTKREHYENHFAFKPEAAVEMLNPLSREYTVMRQSFIHNAMAAVAYNGNRQYNDIKLFEFGKTYVKYSGGTDEHFKLALTVTGDLLPESWRMPDEAADFYFLKGILEGLLTHLGISLKALTLKDEVPAYFDSGLTLKLGKQELGYLGKVNTGMTKEYGARSEVFFAELSMELLIQHSGTRKITHKPVPKFPKVRRDLALLLPADVKFDALEKTAYQTEKGLLKEVNLFDVYTGKNLPEGMKSYAMSFVLRDENKTLTDKHVDKVMEKLFKRFQTEYKAELRA